MHTVVGQNAATTGSTDRRFPPPQARRAHSTIVVVQQFRVELDFQWPLRQGPKSTVDPFNKPRIGPNPPTCADMPNPKGLLD
jgi:hypothetical protein